MIEYSYCLPLSTQHGLFVAVVFMTRERDIVASHVAQLASALHAISVLAIQQSPQPLRVAVIGSQTFAPLSLVTSLIAHLPSSCVVVAGNTDQIERHALATARLYGYTTEEHSPHENIQPENAIDESNAPVQTASIVVAFWDGISAGTQNSIAATRQAGIPVFIISPPPPPNTPVQNTLF